MEKKKSMSMAEEWNRLRDWFYERNLDVGDVVRVMMAVAVAMLGGSLALVVWSLALEAFGMAVGGGGFGWIIGGVAISGAALLLTCGVILLVGAIWTCRL